jgi:hypothetical protein
MADCKAYREEIEELAGVGRLSLEARAHVNACEACRRLEQERASLRRLVAGLGRVEAPADFEFRLRARMAAARAASRRNPLRPVYGFASLAVAALFLLVSASLYVRQERQKVPDATRHKASTADTSAGGAESGPGEKAIAKATVENTTTAPGPVPPGFKNAPRKAVSLATSPARVREVARRGPAGGADAKNLFSVISAPVIGGGPTLTVPVNTNAEPLRVVLRDERGATRVVPMRAVSFGSQELIAREGAGRHAPPTDRGGVW